MSRKSASPLVDMLRPFIGGRVIAYTPGLAKKLGDVKATVLFCQLAFHAYNDVDDPTDWFPLTIAEIEEETGLTRHEQDSVKARLTSSGVIETTLRGVPATTHWRVSFTTLEQLVSGNLDRQESADKIAEKRQPSLPESGKLDRGEPANYPLSKSPSDLKKTRGDLHLDGRQHATTAGVVSQTPWVEVLAQLLTDRSRPRLRAYLEPTIWAGLDQAGPARIICQGLPVDSPIADAPDRLTPAYQSAWLAERAGPTIRRTLEGVLGVRIPAIVFIPEDDLNGPE